MQFVTGYSYTISSSEAMRGIYFSPVGQSGANRSFSLSSLLLTANLFLLIPVLA